MKRSLSILIALLFSFSAYAGDQPNSSARSVLNTAKKEVRTSISGEAAKTIFKLLSETHAPLDSGYKKCKIIQARGIACVEDSRWSKTGEDARYECVFGVDQGGIQDQPPRQHFCHLRAVGVGVGN